MQANAPRSRVKMLSQRVTRHALRRSASTGGAATVAGAAAGRALRTRTAHRARWRPAQPLLAVAGAAVALWHSLWFD
jgi:hypothetical protein